MSVAELKLELIRKIMTTNDLAILMKIEAVLNNSKQTIHEVNEPQNAYAKTEKVYVFNEWQQAKIDKALRQYENGECISDEEAQKEIQAWLED
ncbi:hypothetical protein [Flavobacterium sp.]|uniref:hypothetical protein n=1 Tax=Flavobacterium sp. TaxID=239 RepID=UPI003BCDBCC4